MAGQAASLANTRRPNVRENRILRAMSDRSMTLGFHMRFPEPATIEHLGRFPFDFVFFDGEHGQFELTELQNCCRAAELQGLTIGARVPENNPTLISQYLKAGVQLITVPHVSNRAEARAAIKACYSEPVGERASIGTRANGFWLGVDDLQAAIETMNDNIVLSVLIETEEGVANLDEIMEEDRIGLYGIGRADLAQSLGFRRPAAENPDFKQIVRSIEERIRARGRTYQDDIMKVGRVGEFIADGAKSFLATSGR
jgi:2-keto-3-deoxy-L-rhamnonate aldolase RhmA